MTVNSVAKIIENLAPLAYAEDFDNVGLLVGNPNMEVSGVLVTLDTLENVLDEAVEKNCNIIISFHPIIFGGLKKVTGKTYVERVVMKAIKHDIALYAIHTALDNHFHGVNAKICEVLGLRNRKILIPQKNTIKKITTYVPLSEAENIRNQLFNAGAGSIGNYSNCSFSNNGTASYKANETATPVYGSKGTLHLEAETQLHLTFDSAKEKTIIASLLAHHPYEEVAYEITTLDNVNQHIGMGMIAELPSAMSEKAFLSTLKEKMHLSCIRHSALREKDVKKVAVLGGSGAFAIGAAKAACADVFISADIKYHEFYQAEGQMIIADIGHFESEQFTKNLLVDYLTKKIPNFAVRLSESITNPIKYF